MKGAIEVEINIFVLPQQRRLVFISGCGQQDCCESHCLHRVEQVNMRKEAVVADSFSQLANLVESHLPNQWLVQAPGEHLSIDAVR